VELRYCAAVAVGFSICARPASLVALTPDSVRVAPAAVLVELRVFKYGTFGRSPRLALSLPTDGESDQIRRLFVRLFGDATCREEPWFSLRTLSAAAADGLRAAAAVAPPGTRYTPR
jgi:hypothetical protein